MCDFDRQTELRLVNSIHQQIHHYRRVIRVAKAPAGAVKFIHSDGGGNSCKQRQDDKNK